MRETFVSYFIGSLHSGFCKVVFDGCTCKFFIFLKKSSIPNTLLLIDEFNRKFRAMKIVLDSFMYTYQKFLV